MTNPFDVMLASHLSQAVGLPEFKYEANLKVGPYSFDCMAVVALTERQRYMTDMFEDILITVAMLPSQYTTYVTHGYADMTLTLKQTPYDGGKAKTRKYRAVLEKHQDARMEGNVKDIDQVGALDQMSISLVTFQLLDTASYDLREREVFGMLFRNSTAAEALKSILAKLQLKDEYSNAEAVNAINFDSEYETKKWGTIKIPDGKSLMAVPDYLQDNYGIFRKGLGIFLKHRRWYVFAPYSLTKNSGDNDTLVIINAPAHRARQAAKNFTVVGKTVTVVATGDTSHVKDADREALNEGTGVRYANPKALMSGITSEDPTDKHPTMRPQDYMTEYRTTNYNSPYQRTRTKEGRFSDNDAAIASELARRGGDMVEVTWEHGTLDVLKPGMAVRFFYTKDDKLKELRGTLVSAELHSNIPLMGLAEPRHKNNIRLGLFLKALY